MPLDQRSAITATVLIVAARVLIVAATTLAAHGTAVGQDIPTGGDVLTSVGQDIPTGVRVYQEQRCALCHSIGDDGNKKGPLDGVGSRLSADDIERWMVVPKEMTEETGATRRPFMPAYPDLSAGELDGLVAYMLSLKKP